MKKFLFFAGLCALTLFAYAQSDSKQIYSVNGLPVYYKTFCWMVMPGDTLDISFPTNNNDQYVPEYEQGKVIETDRLNWLYVVPDKPGQYELIIAKNKLPQKFVLNVLVSTPASFQKGEYLNDYRIGNYPQKPFRDNPKYLPPKGFIEVTKENQDLWVSPHFQLKQFLCKQQTDHWPKYVLLDPKLLLKLESIIDGLNTKGPDTDKLFIMSGYRTPYYNASINNGKYSRHIYGDAADIYVDENRDGVIDDLNKDGKSNMKDADVIYRLAEQIEKENPFLIGGLGKYPKTSAHTWDVHVDTRGYKARW